MNRLFISPLLIFFLLLGNSVYAMPYGGVTVVDTVDCTPTDYAAVLDTDVSRGEALMNAMTAIQNGGEFGLGSSSQSIYLSAGTFDIGENNIDLSQGLIRNVLTNNNLHGSGKTLTTIRSAIHGPDSMTAIKPGENSQITDLTIISAPDGGVADYSFPFGVGQETPQPSSLNFGTVFLKNVQLTSPTDGIYFFTETMTMTLNMINVSVSSGWDTIAVIHGTGVTMNIYNSVFDVNGNSSLTNTNYHGINDISGANFNIYNSTFNIQGKNNIYGIYTKGISNVFNTTFTLLSPNLPGTLIGFATHTGGTINLSPTGISNGASSGNVLTISEQTAVVPTPPSEPCANPFRSAPTTSVSPVSQITADEATLNATLDSDGLVPTTTVGFNYGLTTSYGNSSSSTGTYSSGDTFSKTLTGLACGTTYTYQAFATNSEGTGTSTDQSFTTSACPVVQSPVQSSSSFSGGSSISTQELLRIIGITKSETVASSTVPFLFTRNLSIGMRGDDVMLLQKYFNSHGFNLSLYGPGSIGNETSFFGNATKNAVIRFQKAYNITPSVGYFGEKTRGFISKSEK